MAILKRLGKTTRAQQAKFVLGKIAEDIRQTKEGKIGKFIADRQTRTKPLTARNFLAFLSTLARTSPVDVPWESPDNLREDELTNLLKVTDIFAEELFENGKWNPGPESSLAKAFDKAATTLFGSEGDAAHRHAVNICRHHPLQALAYVIAKILDKNNGGDLSLGACYAPTGKIDWEKVESEMRSVLTNPIWDEEYVYNLRNLDELKTELAKQNIL